MSGSLTIEIRNCVFELWGAGGIFQPSSGTLLIADTHFGKTATFRRSGIPVPRGATDRTLQKIEALIQDTRAKKLVLLGDMFHDRVSIAPDVTQSLENFFGRHQQLEISLVPGNHDAWVDGFPDNWPIRIVKPGTELGSMIVSHFPIAAPDDQTVVLCGHVHPAIRVGQAHERMRLPCFWHSRGTMVLPAIGDFTGKAVIRPQATDQVWVLANEKIFEATQKKH